MSTNVSQARSQRRRMQAILRKTNSRIEALRARVLLLLHEGYPVTFPHTKERQRLCVSHRQRRWITFSNLVDIDVSN